MYGWGVRGVGMPRNRKRLGWWCFDFVVGIAKLQAVSRCGRYS